MTDIRDCDKRTVSHIWFYMSNDVCGGSMLWNVLITIPKTQSLG